MHKDDTLLAIRNGKAVLCRKPLAMNATDAAEMADAARAAGVVFGVGQNCRYSRSLEWLREQVRSGSIGEPQLAMAQFYSYPATLTAPRRWISGCGAWRAADPSAMWACTASTHCVLFCNRMRSRACRCLRGRTDLLGRSWPRRKWPSLNLEMTGGIYAEVRRERARAGSRAATGNYGNQGRAGSPRMCLGWTDRWTWCMRRGGCGGRDRDG